MVPHRAVLRLVCDTECTQVRPGDTVAQIDEPGLRRLDLRVLGRAVERRRGWSRSPRTTAIAPRALAAMFASERVTVMATTTALLNAVARDVPDAFRGLSDRDLRRRGRRARAAVGAILRSRAAGPPAQRVRPDRGDDVRDVQRRAGAGRERRRRCRSAARRRTTRSSCCGRTSSWRHRASRARSSSAARAWRWATSTRPSRRRRRFVERAVGPLPPRRLYCTGDRARWRDDGTHRVPRPPRQAGQAAGPPDRVRPRSRPRSTRCPQVRRRRLPAARRTPPTRGGIVAYVVNGEPSRPPPADLMRDPARVAAGVHAADVRRLAARRCRSTPAARSTAARCRRPAMPRRRARRRAGPPARHVRAGAGQDLGAPARRHRGRRLRPLLRAGRALAAGCAARRRDRAGDRSCHAAARAVPRRHDCGARQGAARRGPRPQGADPHHPRRGQPAAVRVPARRLHRRRLLQPLARPRAGPRTAGADRPPARPRRRRDPRLDRGDGGRSRPCAARAAPARPLRGRRPLQRRDWSPSRWRANSPRWARKFRRSSSSRPALPPARIDPASTLRTRPT